MDFIPDRSELQVENLELKDKVVREMVKDIGLKKLIPGKKDRRAAAAEWKLSSGHSPLTFWVEKAYQLSQMEGRNVKRPTVHSSSTLKSLSFALNHKYISILLFFTLLWEL